MSEYQRQSAFPSPEIMDNKAKKRLEVIRTKVHQLKQQLAGAKKQNDDPEEVRRFEEEIKKLEAEATKLRGS
jgi:cob(I)alamin adenosyltransferase